MHIKPIPPEFQSKLQKKSELSHLSSIVYEVSNAHAQAWFGRCTAVWGLKKEFSILREKEYVNLVNFEMIINQDVRTFPPAHSHGG